LSSEIRTSTDRWEEGKNHAESALNRLITTSGGLPRWEGSSSEERRAAVEALRSAVEDAGIPEVAQSALGKRLVRRLTIYRGWETSAAQLAARHVFPSMPKPKVSVKGSLAPKPKGDEVLIGGMLV